MACISALSLRNRARRFLTELRAGPVVFSFGKLVPLRSLQRHAMSPGPVLEAIMANSNRDALRLLRRVATD